MIDCHASHAITTSFIYWIHLSLLKNICLQILSEILSIILFSISVNSNRNVCSFIVYYSNSEKTFARPSTMYIYTTLNATHKYAGAAFQFDVEELVASGSLKRVS